MAGYARHQRAGSREPTVDDELIVSTSVMPAPKEKLDEDKVLVGNLIGEDHVNYVLMYNMLTGIRIGVSIITRTPVELFCLIRSLQVSRCEAKMQRPLTPEDYTASHKFSFDMCVHAIPWFIALSHSFLSAVQEMS